MTTPKTRYEPWFRRYADAIGLADLYLEALNSAVREAVVAEEVASYELTSLVRLVYESNQMEGAGLKKGDTRRVIDEVFGAELEDLPPASPARWVTADGEELLAVEEAEVEEIEEGTFPVLGGDFATHGRGSREVLQHMAACSAAQNVALIEGLDLARLRSWQRGPQAGKGPPFSGDGPRLAVSTRNLQHLHRVLADGLLPDDALVEAGEFRVDHRSVGVDLHFPGPSLVPPAMERFSAWYRDNLMPQAAKGTISLAAESSYRFVSIHPFPDFNGRVSRIILNMVLWSAGVPFAVAIRGTSKSRRRYFASLRYADRGRMQPYEVLVALSVLDGILEVERSLNTALGWRLVDYLAPEKQQKALHLAGGMGLVQ